METFQTSDKHVYWLEIVESLSNEMLEQL